LGHAQVHAVREVTTPATPFLESFSTAIFIANTVFHAF
jgi:hypothetical protein